MIPAVIYTIPPSSPLYHVRYAYIYGATPEFVYVGYTPGYLGAYAYDGAVVFGTGWGIREFSAEIFGAAGRRLGALAFDSAIGVGDGSSGPLVITGGITIRPLRTASIPNIGIRTGAAPTPHGSETT
jgi:hypothetical protein